ncbi:MAG: glycosyltransferase family 4 protein [Chryseolinea sp.]
MSITGNPLSEGRSTLLRITTVPISLQLLLKGQFRDMLDNGYNVITISADGPAVKDVLAEGARHIAVPLTRQITPFQDLKCLWGLVTIINQIKPDIIHTHTPKAGLLGMLAGKICNVPVRMHTVAGLPLMEATGIKRWILEITEKITYAAAHKVYPNSLGLRAFMINELKVSPEKIGMIGKGSSNGIDTQYFTATHELKTLAANVRVQYKIKQDDIVFCFIGRVVKDKGIVELVTAFKKISAKRDPNSAHRNYHLLIVGPFEEELDPLPPDAMRFLREDVRVILAGFQKDIRPWLLASDIFVFPSYREGFPNVVMQASLLEVPCIVSDINGCNEIIEDGVTGLIVPAKDSERLAKGMERLVGDHELRKRFGAKARSFVGQNYERKHIWAEIRGEYAALTARLR